MARGGMSYPLTDSHLLSGFDRHYEEVVARFQPWKRNLERVQFSLHAFRKNPPGGFADAFVIARQIQKNGGDPSLEDNLRWNDPDILHYMKLLAEEEELTVRLGLAAKAVTCRTIIDLMLAAGRLSVCMPEPDDINKELNVLEALRPEVQAELDNPAGTPMELVWRFHVLQKILDERRTDFYADTIPEESLRVLEEAALPLALAISKNYQTIALAEKTLSPEKYNRLTKLVTEGQTSLLSPSPSNLLAFLPAAMGTTNLTAYRPNP